MRLAVAETDMEAEGATIFQQGDFENAQRRRHGLCPFQYSSGHVHDSRPGPFLWGHGPKQKCSGHPHAEFHRYLPGYGYLGIVGQDWWPSPRLPASLVRYRH